MSASQGVIFWGSGIPPVHLSTSTLALCVRFVCCARNGRSPCSYALKCRYEEGVVFTGVTVQGVPLLCPPSAIVTTVILLVLVLLIIFLAKAIQISIKMIQEASK